MSVGAGANTSMTASPSWFLKSRVGPPRATRVSGTSRTLVARGASRKLDVWSELSWVGGRATEEQRLELLLNCLRGCVPRIRNRVEVRGQSRKILCVEEGAAPSLRES